jgi:serine/threonine protein kinase
MAEVWLARRQGDLPQATPLVVKTILPHYACLPEFVSMFLNEARLATRLEHPNIVRVYEAGQADGCHYIAMEYVGGRTLRQILWRSAHFKRLFPVWFALDVAASVCDALEYLHELTDSDGRPLKLLHRDVTPENLMISFTGEVKLLDFGVARALSLPSLTQVGTLKGKYAYMAPELLEVDRQPNEVDCRSDLYSLGVILYEALTGVRPFNAGNDVQLLQMLLDKQRTAEPPSQFAAWVPEKLDRLVLKCIAKHPVDRFQTARSMREALRDFMKNAGLCPSARHIAEQVCGYGDGAEDSNPPPSMRLQSPHEVAHKLDSGCHTVCLPSLVPDFNSLAERRESGFPTGMPQGVWKAHSPMEKSHDWDAALRRVRSEDSAQGNASSDAPPAGAYNSGTFSVHKDPRQEALELFDKSLELLRRHDVEGAIEALRRAAELEPENRLVGANLRRLEQFTTQNESAERRG